MMKINKFLMASGVVAAFTAALHTFAGTPEIQEPLLNSAIPQSISLLLYACWHLVTATLILSAGFLVWSSLNKSKSNTGPLAIFISLMWISFGLVFVMVSLVFSGPSALLMLPQWVLLIPVGILGLIGYRNQASSKTAESF
jgi:hypothetical protein